MKPSDYIREQRIAIDKIYNSFSLLHSSAEITLAKRAVELSKMWFGEVLSLMNEANPYPKSLDPVNKVIEPQAEHTDNTFWDKFVKAERELQGSPTEILELTEISRVKSLREELVNLFKKIEDEIADRLPGVDGKMKFMCEKASSNLLEAKMWLGRELNRIHERQTATKSS